LKSNSEVARNQLLRRIDKKQTWTGNCKQLKASRKFTAG